MIIPDIKDYPKFIYLREDKYKIRFVKGLKDLGYTNPSKGEILIKAGMSKNETFRTFLHELLHVIEFSWPVKIKHKTVYKLEEALFSLIIDNFT